MRAAAPSSISARADQRRQRTDAPAIDAQSRRDLAGNGAWRDDEAEPQTRRQAFRQRADMNGQFGLDAGQGRGRIVGQRPIDVILDDQDIVAPGDRHKLMPALFA